MYNITNLTASNNAYELLMNLSSLSGDLLGLVLLIVIFSISFINLKYFHDTKESLSLASVIGLIAGIIFRILGLVNDTFIFVMFLLVLIILLVKLGKD